MNKFNKKYNKKILRVLLIMVIIFTNTVITNVSYSSNDIEEIYVTFIGTCDQRLMYNGTEVIDKMLTYYIDTKTTPTYLVERSSDKRYGTYITVGESIEDEGILAILRISNEYYTDPELRVKFPYLTTYHATQQAIYCYLEGNMTAEGYEYIYGYGGQNALIVLKDILNKVGRGIYTKPSSEVSINDIDDKWQISDDGKTAYKEYEVSSKTNFSIYNVEHLGDTSLGVSIVSNEGEEKTEFTNGENFRICILIDEIGEKINLDIKVSVLLETYPAYYASSSEAVYIVTLGDFEEVSTTFSELVNIKKDIEEGNNKSQEDENGEIDKEDNDNEINDNNVVGKENNRKSEIQNNNYISVTRVVHRKTETNNKTSVQTIATDLEEESNEETVKLLPRTGM